MAARCGWGDGRGGSVQVEHPADAAMRISVRRQSGDRIADADQTLTFDASGSLVDEVGARSAVVVTRDGMIGLHAARFAPVAMRWLFFLSGVAGTLMVATGLVLWTVKRREQLPDTPRPHQGFRIVERQNNGFVAGQLATDLTIAAGDIVQNGTIKGVNATAAGTATLAITLMLLAAEWREYGTEVALDVTAAEALRRALEQLIVLPIVRHDRDPVEPHPLALQHQPQADPPHFQGDHIAPLAVQIPHIVAMGLQPGSDLAALIDFVDPAHRQRQCSQTRCFNPMFHF